MKVNSSPQRSSSKLARDAPAVDNEEAVDVVARDDVNNGRYNTPPEHTEIDTYQQREGGTLLAASRDCNGLTQLDRIERMMMEFKADNERLEANMTELKAGNERLEAKVRSLESNYELGTQSLKAHIDASLSKCLDLAVSNNEWVKKNLDKAVKLNEYNRLLLQNQKWEYPADAEYEYALSKDYWLSEGYTNKKASAMASFAASLKKKTIELRQGITPDVVRPSSFELRQGITRNMAGIFIHRGKHLIDATSAAFTPHWKEFADALKQYTPALNLLDCPAKLFHLHLPLREEVRRLIGDALMRMPFTDVNFSTSHIMDVAESNGSLRNLMFTIGTIKPNEIDRICAIASNLEQLTINMSEPSDSVIGNALLTGLFSRDLNLELLCLSLTCDSDIILSPDTITVLANFLASNPRLEVLGLSVWPSNDFGINDSDTPVIANALRRNTTLRRFGHFSVNDNSMNVFARLLCDESSLNAVADSNHRCNVRLRLQHRHQNHSRTMAENRAAKIYLLLRSRHFSSEVMSNAELFNDIDVEMLPYALEAIQKYAKVVVDMKDYRGQPAFELERENLGCLSIIYDVMRNWDTALDWYESAGTALAS